MKKVTITKELIESYPHKNSATRPTRPYCRLCANFDRRVWIRQGKRVTNFRVHIFQIGEEAIMCKFRNGTIAYYELSCWNDPEHKHRVENIMKQDVGD